MDPTEVRGGVLAFFLEGATGLPITGIVCLTYSTMNLRVQHPRLGRVLQPAPCRRLP